MKQYIDLHMHTNCSDGSKSPSELLELVRKSKIEAFSVTDHDTLEGSKKVAQLLTDEDPKLISGVEISVTVDNADMHLLAYLFDEENDQLNSALDDFLTIRKERGRKIVEKLNSLGIDLKFEDVEKVANSDIIGRPHIAQALYNEGYTSFYEEAFIKYISDKGPAYVLKENFTPQKAIKIVHEAGGVVVLAHPGIGEKDKYLDMMISYGLDGLEAYHSSHKQSQVDYFKHLADRHRLIVTGGSDYHGRESRDSKIGSQRVPLKLMDKLYLKAEERRGKK